jgi:carboxypeptidase PM20D1
LVVDAASAARRLGEAVQARTVSFAPGIAPASDEFRKLHRHLESSFPKAHAAMKRETVGGLTLLYTWEGREPGARPIVLMAHQDVVPIAPGTEGAWKAPPFSGRIDDGFVWGRGAWDNKSNLMAMLEAIEQLSVEGFRPRQTLHLVFGHDEEIGGRAGALAAAELLKSRGVRAEFVLDEGLLITEGILSGLAAPAALIGLAEKGYLTLELTATGTPGHSSMPPQQTAIGLLAAALTRLEAAQRPAAIRGVAAEMFAAVAPEMSGLNRVLLSNLWITGPLVRRELEKGASTKAMLRTTTAATVLQAGDRDNVLPGSARALVNFRLLPGDTIADVVAHVRKVAGEGIAVEPQPGASEASPVASTSSTGYRTIERTVREIFPETIVAPGLMIAATDSRHMTGVSDQILRFSPVRARAADLSRFHGTDERISIANYVEMIRFYHRLIGNASVASGIAAAR